MVTTFMEIMQIQRIINHLVDAGSQVTRGTDFELYDKNDRPYNDDCIDTPPHPGNGVLEVHFPRMVVKSLLENRDLLGPCIALRQGQLKGILLD